MSWAARYTPSVPASTTPSFRYQTRSFLTNKSYIMLLRLTFTSKRLRQMISKGLSSSSLVFSRQQELTTSNKCLSTSMYRMKIYSSSSTRRVSITWHCSDRGTSWCKALNRVWDDWLICRLTFWKSNEPIARGSQEILRKTWRISRLSWTIVSKTTSI